MFKTLLIIGSALVLLFGAAGVSIAAAQDSQLGEPLYGLKEWSRQMQWNRDQLQDQAQTQMQQINGQAGSAAGLQEQDRIRLQEQDQIRLQTQDRLQVQDRLHQSQNLGQPNQGGGNPWTTGTPTPYSGYGPGPGPDTPCPCTPQQQRGGESNRP